MRGQAGYILNCDGNTAGIFLNRTIVELKLIAYCDHHRVSSNFNRTNVELKHKGSDFYR